MGGQQGSRGYLYQGIVSIFNACAETGWDKISVEYTTPNDKVDIALISGTGEIIRAIQVKSSVNLFSKEDLKKWLADLIDDVSAQEYQLILIGNCQDTANIFRKSVNKLSSNDSLDSEATNSLGSFQEKILEKKVNIQLLPFDEEHLLGIVRDSLNRFISIQGYSIRFSALEQICYALITLHMLLGTKGDAISKTDYEKRITEWLISSANGEMKRNEKYSELEVNFVCQDNDSFTNTGTSIPFPEIRTLQSYRDSFLSSGALLIQRIQEISLPPFTHVRERAPCNPEKMQKYLDKYDCGKIEDFDFTSFPQYVRSELPDTQKRDAQSAIQKYWNISVPDSFFYVGDLSESTLLTPITGNTDYNGTELEKVKNLMIHKLIWKAQIIEDIDFLCETLENVHLLRLCVVNSGNVADKNITVSLMAQNPAFRLFSFSNEVHGDRKELLDVMADSLIEERIIEKALNIEETSNISIEPEEHVSQIPFVMPNLFGRRREYNFEDLILEWEKYQAEVGSNGMITYEFSALRPGEAKWLSPYMIIVPATNSFTIEYTILSESLGCKKHGALTIHVKGT